MEKKKIDIREKFYEYEKNTYMEKIRNIDNKIEELIKLKNKYHKKLLRGVKW